MFKNLFKRKTKNSLDKKLEEELLSRVDSLSNEEALKLAEIREGRKASRRTIWNTILGGIIGILGTGFVLYYEQLNVITSKTFNSWFRRNV